VLLGAVETKPVVVIGRSAYSESTGKAERGERRRVSVVIQRCWIWRPGV
jgi:hypothetical protein